MAEKRDPETAIILRYFGSYYLHIACLIRKALTPVCDISCSSSTVYLGMEYLYIRIEAAKPNSAEDPSLLVYSTAPIPPKGRRIDIKLAYDVYRRKKT